MTISVLLDMNMSPDWAGFLARAGYPTAHWGDRGDPTASDSIIMTWAIEHGHVVLTRDLDFGTALALTRAKGPSVIQIRAKNILPEEIGDHVLAVLRRHEAELTAGALIVVGELNSRVRILPF